MKTCTKCGVAKELEAFGKISAFRGRAPRRMSWCRGCVKDRQRPEQARNPSEKCGVDDCTRREARRGYCARHYKLLYRNGDPTVQLRETSTEGKSPAARAEFVKDYKVRIGCADCGYSGPPQHLTFDHLPGTTKIRDIKSGQQLGWKALLAEIEKCDVVCWFCHIDRTMGRREEVI